MMVWAKAKLAASVFLAGAVTIGGAALVMAQAAGPATRAYHRIRDDYPKLAPFSALRWNGDVPEVQVESDTWYELQAINEVPAKEIIAFSRSEYKKLWQKRFVEDLVQVMDQMKHPVGERVDLKLRDLSNNQTRQMTNVMMTHEKRQMLWDARQHQRRAEDEPDQKK